ncbi:microtubule-associated protein 6 homolog isoform X1 [Etheostoma spectabile]|uniref:microtubule-associated protein 6 homolog isoform X1 n=1 Tax=Etheostoma spectabile TaxID=54343 RepID=UPI0013AF6F5C|nr:microtubule-associated protein 6 homolog isoform X1 [Etheostoma spectabile]XP_032366174.1 microtubule-associated protein 6 homolog isoform X1 [Etheostoma spectabile]
MAWPCITRACCINRFWTELDKGDIAVPLVFTKYSDVADVQHFPHHPQPKLKRAAAIAIETQPHPDEQEAGKAPPATGAAAAGDGSASVMRQDFKAWKVRPEPSCKPRNEYQRSAAPFNTETQYQKDYKPWPIPKKHDHPWIPKASPTAATGTLGGPERSAGSGAQDVATEAESGVEKSEIEEKTQEKESKEATKRSVKREKSADRHTGEKTEKHLAADVSAEQRKGRAAADALNRQIKQVMTTSSYRTEFKAYKDVKQVKAIKAPCQYQPPVEETSLETSYSATYKGEQVKAHPADNKLMERRRIRSLYNEPSKEPSKVDKPVSRTKPKKTPTTTTGKMVKKSKEKQIASSQSAKKKPSLGAPEPKPDGAVTKKSKEISNRLAEAKQ